MLVACTAENPAFDPDRETGADTGVAASTSSDPGPTGAQGPTSADTTGFGDGGETAATGDEPPVGDETTTTDHNSGETTASDQTPVELLLGEWFACENIPNNTEPTDDCYMLDDEGMRFDPDGTLWLLEWDEAPQQDCSSDPPHPGSCFPADHPDPGPFDFYFFGTWSVVPPVLDSPTEVTINVHHVGSDCEGTIRWEWLGDVPYERFVPGDDDGCGLLAFPGSSNSALQPQYWLKLEP